MESIELFLESTSLKKEDWWNASDRLCILSQGRRNWGGGIHCKKRNVANIVKSDVCNGLFPAMNADILPCQCCECLDPPPMDFMIQKVLPSLPAALRTQQVNFSESLSKVSRHSCPNVFDELRVLSTSFCNVMHMIIRGVIFVRLMKSFSSISFLIYQVKPLCKLYCMVMMNYANVGISDTIHSCIRAFIVSSALSISVNRLSIPSLSSLFVIILFTLRVQTVS